MNNSTRFIGMDDSKEAIQVAIADAGRRGEVRDYGSIPNTPEALRKLVRRLGRPKDLHFAYEAGRGPGPGARPELVPGARGPRSDGSSRRLARDCSDGHR